jgi:hypothetical protein
LFLSRLSLFSQDVIHFQTPCTLRRIFDSDRATGAEVYLSDLCPPQDAHKDVSRVFSEEHVCVTIPGTRLYS